MATKKLKIGLLGCGTVGRGLLELVERNRTLLAERSGVELSVTKVLVRDPGKVRPGVDVSLLTTRPEEVVRNGCDIVVELLGGVEPAGSLVAEAIDRKKNVVTANKALLAARGVELFAAAARNGVRIGFEASVCAGIPIVRALESGLAGNRVQAIAAILNGTSNFVLTRMAEH